MRLFKRKPKFELQQGHATKYAFTCAGIDYYEFDDANNIPCDRSFTAVSCYEELRMKCTREFLIAHTDAVQNIYGNPKTINPYEAMRLNMQLQERLNMIFEPDTILKLASVVYFDKNEDPYHYDYKYNLEKKIPSWRKEGVESFFLRLPIRKLIPSGELSDSDLQAYTKVAELMTTEHLETILRNLSPDQLKGENLNLLRLLRPTA